VAQVGPFQLGEAIGVGGMARVFRGRHLRSGTDVAIKVLNVADADHAFEVRAAASLDHPRIVRVFDYGTLASDFDDAGTGLTPGLPWIAMELVEGRSLHDLRPDAGWLAIRACLLALLDALGHAHAHDIVHRDLKPRNVLLDRSRSAPWGLKLADFGIAWMPGRTDKDATYGTPAYMAPEQIEMVQADIGPHTDLYALGIIAWRLCTGKVPFRSGDGVPIMVKQVARPLPDFTPATQVPDGVEAWLRKLLEKDPSRRYARAAEAAAALLGDGDGLGILMPDWRRETPLRPPGLADTGLRLLGLRKAPFVGRERERDALWDALTTVVDKGSSQAVLVSGARGSGRSRLAIGVARRADELGLAHRFVATHARQPGPFDGLTPMVEAVLGTTDLDREQTLQRLDRLVERQQLARRLVLPLLALLRRQRGDAPQAEERLFEIIRQTLCCLAGDRLPVVVLDDVHTSASSQDFAAAWTRSGDRGLLILTATPSARVEIDALEVDLPALSADEATAMAQRLLPMSPELAETLRATAEGHPFYVVELVKDWVDRDLVEPGPDGFRLVGTPTLPGGLRAIWLGRLQAAMGPRGDPRLPGLLAVLGVAADPDELAAACRYLGIAPSDMRHSLDALARSGLIWVRKRQLGWSHRLLRESLLEGDDLPALHRAAATAVRLVRQDRAADREARHLHAAGDHVAAAEAYRRAAWMAYRRGRFHGALEHAEQMGTCLDLAELPQVASERADEPVLRWTLLGVLGRPDEAREVVARTARLLQQLTVAQWTDAWHLTDLHLRWALSAENPLLCAQLARDAMKTLSETPMGSPAWRRLAVLGQDVMVRTGHRHEAADLAHRQAEWLEHDGQPALAAYMRVMAASTVAETHSVAEVRRLVNEALTALARVGLTELSVTVLDQLGEVYRDRSRYEEAAETYEAALALCEKHHLRSGALPAYNLGMCRLQQDQPGATRAFSLARERIQLSGPAWLVPFVDAADGVARVRAGDRHAWPVVRGIYATHLAVGAASNDLVQLAELAAEALTGSDADEARAFADDHRKRLI